MIFAIPGMMSMAPVGKPQQLFVNADGTGVIPICRVPSGVTPLSIKITIRELSGRLRYFDDKQTRVFRAPAEDGTGDTIYTARMPEKTFPMSQSIVYVEVDGKLTRLVSQITPESIGLQETPRLNP